MAISGTVERAGDPADGLGSTEPDPAEGITTVAIGGVSETSGATFSGSASVQRCTGDGSPSVGAGGVCDGVAAVGSAGGGDAKSGSGSTGVLIARWRARSGTVERAVDPADGLGSAEPDPAAEGITTEAIGGESDISGATSSGAV
jgi:hypothetical protein